MPISLLHRREKKKLDPEKKERGALECENSWEEEIKTKYIYIYRNWAFHNLFLTKKKIDMVKTKIELLRIVKRRNITYLKIKMRPCSG